MSLLTRVYGNRTSACVVAIIDPGTEATGSVLYEDKAALAANYGQTY